jgi:apolipoprotein N-acyltransferase
MGTTRRIRIPLDAAWLILGGLFFTFIGFRWSMPVAAWLAPVFLIRFFRSQKRWYRTLPAIPLLILSACAKFLGFWDFPLLYQILVCVLVPGPFYFALYADRILARKIPSSAGGLVFPAFLVGVEYLMGKIPGLGTTGSIAVSQLPIVPLIQLASVTGIWGISFLIGWFASAFNLLWENGFELPRAWKPLLPLFVCSATVMLAGEIRASAFKPREDTVKVGSISVDHGRGHTQDLFRLVDAGTPRERALEYRAELRKVRGELFEWSAKAAASGADIVFWSEANLFVLPEEEEAFMEEARAFALEQGIYFVPAVCVMRYGKHYGDNKLVLINPQGKIEYQYRKTKTIYQTESDGIIRYVDTPFGRLGAAICFDLDFPDFVRQAGTSGIDLMLVPAFDSRGSNPYHTYTGLFRALENGFNMVRQTNHGTSMAIDYQGHIIARQDFFKTRVRLMLADLPGKGRRTLYASAGYWFAWLCLAFALFAAGWAMLRKQKGA